MKSLVALLCVLMTIPTLAQKPKLVPYVDFWDENNEVKKSQGQYLDGLEHGLWKYWYQDGEMMEKSNYYRGKLHGEVIRFHENGVKSHHGYFEMNQPDSLLEAWYDNENKKESGYFESGEKVGEWKYFYRDGDAKLVENHVGDTLLVEAYWNERGEQTIANGTGFLIERYDNDTLKTYFTYQDGLRNGSVRKTSTMVTP